MTAKQQTQILAIIAKDCKVKHVFVNDYGTCVNGALALASGIPRKKVKCVINIASDSARFIRVAIEKKFGLTLLRLWKMQRLNDSAKTLTKRRKALKNFVKSIPAK